MRGFSGAAVVVLLACSVVVGGSPAAASASCSLEPLAKDPRLASFSGIVTDAASGKVLFSRSGAKAKRTGSVLKLLTASAAIRVLGPTHRLTTRVVAGAKPGTIVLVGGGDPTLSRVPSSFYPGAPRLSDLAAQVRRAVGSSPIRKIVVDSSYWPSADSWDSTWKRSEQRIGYLSEVSALQVDGDRANPRLSVSPRGTDPALRAGGWFASALGVPSVAVVRGTAPADGRRLGVVRSQPVSSLVKTMLLTSDGTLGEALARVTSVESGSDGSARSLDRVFSRALSHYGLDTASLRIRDGSGLSARNAVSPLFVTQLLRKLHGPLAPVRAGLSVAGRTGSLAGRFGGSPARGHIVAKTGWIDSEYALAGLVTARDGTRLAFTFYAIGSHVTPRAKVALDALATRVYTCGGRLG